MKFAAFAFVASLCSVAVTVKAVDDPNIEADSFLVNSGNCIMKTVSNITVVADRFISDVKDCNGIINEKEKEILNSVTNIKENANEVTRVNNLYCNGGKYIGVECRSKMTKPLYNLVANVVDCSGMLLHIWKVPGAVSGCVWDASHGIGDYFMGFPGRIKHCIW